MTSDDTVERFFILSAEANIHDEDSDKLSLQSLIIFCNKRHHLLFFYLFEACKEVRQMDLFYSLSPTRAMVQKAKRSRERARRVLASAALFLDASN